MSGDREWPQYGDGPPGERSPWGQEPSVGAPTPTPTPTPVQPVPYRGPNNPPPPPPGSGGRVLSLLVGVLLIAVLGIVGIVAVVIATNGDDTDSATDRSSDTDDRLPDVPTPVTPDLPSDSPDVLEPPDAPSEAPTGSAGPAAPTLSVEGFDAFVDAVADRGRGTKVFSAVVYPDYAIVDVPLEKGTPREQGLQWNGSEFSDFGPPDSASTELVDLALVDSDFLVELVGRAKKLVDDPTSWYVIIEGASTVFDDDGTRIRAYASNDTDTAYIATRLDGTIVRRYIG